MRNIRFFLPLLCLFLLLLTACGGRGRRSAPEGKAEARFAPVDVPAFPLSVYLENSGSIAGFVRSPQSEYRNLVYDLVSGLEHKGLARSVRLHLIAERTDSMRAKVEHFFTPLDAARFNAPTSDMISMFSTLLKRRKPGEVTVFVSDCVFTSANPALSVSMLSASVKDRFAEALRRERLSAVMHCVDAAFEGAYYPPKAHARSFSGRRPLYIWLIGPGAALAVIERRLPFGQLGNGLGEKALTAAWANPLPRVNYRVRRRAQLGGYELDRSDPDHTISKAKVGTSRDRSGFALTLEANLSALPLPEAHLLDPAAYRVRHRGFQIDEVRFAEGCGSERVLITLTLTQDNAHSVPRGKVEVDLLRTNPPGIAVLHESDGTRPVDGRTFGVQHLFDGVSAAYALDSETLATLSFTIK